MYADEQALDHLLPIAGKPEHRPVTQRATDKERVEDPIRALRSHTCRLQYALEKTSTARELLSPSITLQRYAENLVIWAAAWQTIEHWLCEPPFAKEVPQLLPRPRAWLVQADLVYLYSNFGIRPFDKASHLSTFEALSFELVNFSGFIGVCYVLVGASLGRLVIAKHLETTLAVIAEHGASFFSAGNDDDLSWTQWIRSANAVLSIENDIHAACHWASATSELLLTAFWESTYIAIDDALDRCDAGPDGDPHG